MSVAGQGTKQGRAVCGGRFACPWPLILAGCIRALVPAMILLQESYRRIEETPRRERLATRQLCCSSIREEELKAKVRAGGRMRRIPRPCTILVGRIKAGKAGNRQGTSTEYDRNTVLCN